MTDIIDEAKSILRGVTEGPWIQVGYGNIHRYPVGDHPPVGKVYGLATGDFIAWCRVGVPALLTELEYWQDRAHAAEQELLVRD